MVAIQRAPDANDDFADEQTGLVMMTKRHNPPDKWRFPVSTQVAFAGRERWAI